jgi:hypothetical protein
VCVEVGPGERCPGFLDVHGPAFRSSGSVLVGAVTLADRAATDPFGASAAPRSVSWELRPIAARVQGLGLDRVILRQRWLPPVNLVVEGLAE